MTGFLSLSRSTVIGEPEEIMRARWLASNTSSKRFSTLSMQSSTVTRAISVPLLTRIGFRKQPLGIDGRMKVQGRNLSWRCAKALLGNAGNRIPARPIIFEDRLQRHERRCRALDGALAIAPLTTIQDVFPPPPDVGPPMD